MGRRSSQKEARIRLRIRQEQESGPVKGARKTTERRRAWRLALTVLSYSKLGGRL
jgi:hypothetical protein